MIESNTFVFAQMLDFSAIYDIVFKSDPGVYYGTKAESCLSSDTAYVIRQHLRGNGQEDECGKRRQTNQPVGA